MKYFLLVFVNRCWKHYLVPARFVIKNQAKRSEEGKT